MPTERVQLQQWHLRGVQVVLFEEQPVLPPRDVLFVLALVVGGEEGLDAIGQAVGPLPPVHDDLIVVEPLVVDRLHQLVVLCIATEKHPEVLRPPRPVAASSPIISVRSRRVVRVLRERSGWTPVLLALALAAVDGVAAQDPRRRARSEDDALHAGGPSVEDRDAVAMVPPRPLVLEEQ
eukprot:scaffold100768_cov61-Phaeocystis_antarctica.AAC.10